MNFDDRLRNHLQDQHDELTIRPSAVEDVHARSARRKQKRLAATTLGICAIALLAFGVFMNNGSTTTDFATGGADDAPTTTTAPATDDAVEAVAVDAPLESSLPEPGESLVLTAANNDSAPGGYSIASSGVGGGVYYVVSTAPGARWEDFEGGEYPRPSTVYTFDGSSWSNNTMTGDRFVGGITNGSEDVLYAISTGTPTNSGLAIGSSTNLGTDWEWTSIDLTDLFGPDPASWPAYAAEFATHGSQQLVVINSNPQVDTQEAFELAVANGADITSADQVMYADQNGVAWFDDTPVEIDPNEPVNCQRLLNQRSMELWEDVDYGAEPDFDFEDEPTPEQAAEIEAFFDKSNAQQQAIQAQMVETVREFDECTEFADCVAEMFDRQNAVNDDIAKLYEDAGLSQFEEPTDELADAIEEYYSTLDESMEAWADESGCAEHLDSDAEAYAEMEQYASWDELGVTPSSEWAPIRHAFLVEGDEVTSLGNPFGNDTAFVVDVNHDGSAWNVTIDSSSYTSSQDGPSITRWSSKDGQTWNSVALDHYSYGTNVHNGTTFSVDHSSENGGIVTTAADGTVTKFSLSDLAPGLDGSDAYISNISTGDYGVVAWAVEWNRSGYNSVLLYSPDGMSWGATEVPDQEITNAIVGEDGVLVFVNDPEREVGDPQPIFFASA